MATLSCFSRKALATTLSTRCHHLCLTISTNTASATTEPAKSISPTLDRVKWDCRGQRKIIPLGQWLLKVAIDAYVQPNVVLVSQVYVCDESSVCSGSVLRGDLNKISVGFISNVLERCVVHAAWSSLTGRMICSAGQIGHREGRIYTVFAEPTYATRQ